MLSNQLKAVDRDVYDAIVVDIVDRNKGDLAAAARWVHKGCFLALLGDGVSQEARDAGRAVLDSAMKHLTVRESLTGEAATIGSLLEIAKAALFDSAGFVPSEGIVINRKVAALDDKVADNLLTRTLGYLFGEKYTNGEYNHPKVLLRSSGVAGVIFGY